MLALEGPDERARILALVSSPGASARSAGAVPSLKSGAMNHVADPVRHCREVHRVGLLRNSSRVAFPASNVARARAA